MSAIAITSESRQRWFVAGLLTFLVALSIPYSVKVLSRDNGSAIVRWRGALQEMEAGVDVWERGYPNTPFLSLLLVPFGVLPPLAGALCWFYVKAALTVAALYWVFRLVEAPGRPFPVWGQAVVVLLSLRPIMGDLSHGNVNLLILFLIVAALYAFRQGRDILSGLVLALAVACKLTPVLFVPYFLWKRAWKVLAGCSLGLILFFGIVPGVFLGAARNAEMFRSWVEHMVKPYAVQGVITYSEHKNQSLPGLLARLASDSPSFSTYVGTTFTPLRYHNLWSLEAASIRWILLGCMAAFACLCLWACRTPAAARLGWRLPAEYSLVILGMLLFNERTWKHHGVTLVVPFAVIAYYLAAYQPNGKLRAFLIGTLAAVFLLMASTSTSSSLDKWFEMGKLAQVYGAYVWAYLVLVVALAVLLCLGEEKQPLEVP